MRPFKKIALTMTAIATLATSVFANVCEGQLTSYSDQQVLNYLVREYARDPSTFEDAHAYILLNRPAIVEDYLRQTLDRAPDARRFSLSEPSAGETSGVGSVIVLGIARMAAALSLADNGGGENPGPEPSPPPTPIKPEPGPSPCPNPNPIYPDNYTGGYLYNDCGTLVELTSDKSRNRSIPRSGWSFGTNSSIENS